MTLILLLFPHPSLSRPLPSTSVSHDGSMDQRGHRHSSGSSALSRIDTEFLSRCRQRWQIISKNNTPWIRPSISSVTFMSMSIFYWIHGVHVRTFSYWFLSKLKLQSNRNGLKFLFSVLFWSANNKLCITANISPRIQDRHCGSTSTASCAVWIQTNAKFWSFLTTYL